MERWGHSRIQTRSKLVDQTSKNSQSVYEKN